MFKSTMLATVKSGALTNANRLAVKSIVPMASIGMRAPFLRGARQYSTEKPKDPLDEQDLFRRYRDYPYRYARRSRTFWRFIFGAVFVAVLARWAFGPSWGTFSGCDNWNNHEYYKKVTDDDGNVKFEKVEYGYGWRKQDRDAIRKDFEEFREFKRWKDANKDLEKKAIN